MGDSFPELIKQQDLIQNVIKEEEVSFFQTLANGISKINDLMTSVKAAGKDTLAGEDVFRLSDTFGFPEDLTELIARENGLKIDHEGFQKSKKRAVEIAQAATKIESDDWVELREDDVEEFIGYDFL